MYLINDGKDVLLVNNAIKCVDDDVHFDRIIKVIRLGAVHSTIVYKLFSGCISCGYFNCFWDSNKGISYTKIKQINNTPLAKLLFDY